ncbi:hypothetical protein COY05_01695 [Candidatus Peregrinibacteria bacterium CG_4_10_14_0_2_um_filter_38_24]|nr:MAG: hypothetical protein COY05_01695 [Candidatus Peregrinibacteria bacterium CG_4_10_14_0_2_um_filter_38_24]PJC39039.1 MAG: hypothetical protein CO044_01760 [Candidatus Peregrinibacteria bacterium CG_4_9_14_0_2_um_filter_38_9]
MRNKLLISLVVMSSILMMFAAGCGPKAPEPIKAGDGILALWYGGSTWWLGTADTACDNGLNVKWADGSSPTCTVMTDIIREVPATKDAAVVGASVYAKLSGTKFSKATITAVNGDSYSVEYADKTTKDGVTLADLRM